MCCTAPFSSGIAPSQAPFTVTATTVTPHHHHATLDASPRALSALSPSPPPRSSFCLHRYDPTTNTWSSAFSRMPTQVGVQVAGGWGGEWGWVGFGVGSSLRQQGTSMSGGWARWASKPATMLLIGPDHLAMPPTPQAAPFLYNPDTRPTLTPRRLLPSTQTPPLPGLHDARPAGAPGHRGQANPAGDGRGGDQRARRGERRARVLGGGASSGGGRGRRRQRATGNLRKPTSVTTLV